MRARPLPFGAINKMYRHMQIPGCFDASLMPLRGTFLAPMSSVLRRNTMLHSCSTWCCIEFAKQIRTLNQDGITAQHCWRTKPTVQSEWQQLMRTNGKHRNISIAQTISSNILLTGNYQLEFTTPKRKAPLRSLSGAFLYN
jgi:hypothetical protein